MTPTKTCTSVVVKGLLVDKRLFELHGKGIYVKKFLTVCNEKDVTHSTLTLKTTKKSLKIEKSIGLRYS